MNAIVALASGIGLVALGTIGITIGWYGIAQAVEIIRAVRCMRWVMILGHALAQIRKDNR